MRKQSDVETRAKEDRQAEPHDSAGLEKDEEEEWELDPNKLAAALENEQLMSKIPEVDREWFTRLARRSIEAQERFELCDRVRRAFDELSQAMKEGLHQTSHQLAVALTFEQLKSKQRQ
jgi:2-oxoglutarate dehydrogenase complex dehydrogenase (E1) component-like enzyme